MKNPKVQICSSSIFKLTETYKLAPLILFANLDGIWYYLRKLNNMQQKIMHAVTHNIGYENKINVIPFMFVSFKITIMQTGWCNISIFSSFNKP